METLKNRLKSLYINYGCCISQFDYKVVDNIIILEEAIFNSSLSREINNREFKYFEDNQVIDIISTVIWSYFKLEVNGVQYDYIHPSTIYFDSKTGKIVLTNILFANLQFEGKYLQSIVGKDSFYYLEASTEIGVKINQEVNETLEKKKNIKADIEAFGRLILRILTLKSAEASLFFGPKNYSENLKFIEINYGNDLMNLVHAILTYDSDIKNFQTLIFKIMKFQMKPQPSIQNQITKRFILEYFFKMPKKTNILRLYKFLPYNKFTPSEFMSFLHSIFLINNAFVFQNPNNSSIYYLYSTINGDLIYTGTLDKNFRRSGKGISYSKLDIYYGDFYNDMRNGYGEIYYNYNNEYYNGEWQNDKREGDGILFYNNENKKYEGKWKNDKYHDFGKYVNEAGNLYEGQFNDGKKEGNGILYNTIGQKYLEGSWKADKKEGDFFEYHSGERTLINFVDDQKKIAIQNKANKKKTINIILIEEDIHENDTIIGEKSKINIKLIPNLDQENKIIKFEKPKFENVSIDLNQDLKKSSINLASCNIIETIDQNNDVEKITKNKEKSMFTNSIYGVPLTHQDIENYNDKYLLNSNNMNFYMKYIDHKYEAEFWNEENNLAYFTEKQYKKFYFFSDIFYAQLTNFKSLYYNEQQSNEIYYNRVKSYTKQFKSHNNKIIDEVQLIFDIYDKLLFIINLENSHWILAEIDTTCDVKQDDIDNFEKPIQCQKTHENDFYTFKIYDSLVNPSTSNSMKILETLKEWAIMECKVKCDSNSLKFYLEKINRSKYKIEDVQQQTNFYDCGIFVCGFLNDIVNKDSNIKFSQKDAKKKRIELIDLANQCLNKTQSNVLID